MLGLFSLLLGAPPCVAPELSGGWHCETNVEYVVVAPVTFGSSDSSLTTSWLNEDWGQAGIEFASSGVKNHDRVGTSFLYFSGRNGLHSCGIEVTLTGNETISVPVGRFAHARKAADSFVQLFNRTPGLPSVKAVPYRGGVIVVPEDPIRSLAFELDAGKCKIDFVRREEYDSADGLCLHEATVVTSDLPQPGVGVRLYLVTEVHDCERNDKKKGFCGSWDPDLPTWWRVAMVGGSYAASHGSGAANGRVPSHEIGHILLNSGCHPNNSENLMQLSPSSSSCKLTSLQARAARSFVKNKLGGTCKMAAMATPSGRVEVR